jgi:hypothetical protein
MSSRRNKEKNNVQGEGDYRSAREFNEKERSFVRSHDTNELGEAAAPDSPDHAAELERAEEEARARARPDPETDAEDSGRPRDGRIKGVPRKP